MRFQDIPEFVQAGAYQVHIPLRSVPETILWYIEQGLDMSPEFQRAHVWTVEQKISFMEYFLQNGRSGRVIYFNNPAWGRLLGDSWFVLVDGKQRLDAILGFLSNEFPVFGSFYRDFTDSPDIMRHALDFNVNCLPTYEMCLQWYLQMNSGGTPHTPEEIDLVRDLLDRKVAYTQPCREELERRATLGREIFAGLKSGEERKEGTQLQAPRKKKR